MIRMDSLKSEERCGISVRSPGQEAKMGKDIDPPIVAHRLCGNSHVFTHDICGWAK